MNVRIVSITTALLLAGTPLISSAGDKSPSTPVAQSSEFLREAIQGNLAEVKLGQLAQQKGQTDGVKDMGAMLEKDHAKSNREAMQVAQKLSVAPPKEPNAEQKAVYDRLSRLSGKEFDQQFIEESVKAHQKTIKLFEKEEAKANDAAASYAKETLPALRHHLQMSQDLQSKQVPAAGG
jgi:putative membrane protein